MTNKTMVIAIALLLMLTIAASLVAVLPIAEAQTLQYYPSFIFIAAAPDPVGAGQSVTFVLWTGEMPPETPDTPSLGAPGGRATWVGITVTVTKPDGSSETIKMPVTDPVGSTWYTYVPNVVGKYSIQAHFPETWKNTTSYRRLYKAADSDIVTFTVQQEQLSILPGVPLPTEYWTRPIHAYNREWSQIAGNWITGTPSLSQITAPDTAHVMWTQPYFFGGLAGETYKDYGGSISYYEGTSYEAKFGGVTIMQGKLFYNLNLASSSTGSQGKVVARDLQTGELQWERNNTSISMSTIYLYVSPNQHGVHPYLWVTGNSALDPFSGTELFRFTDVPSGTTFVGPKGEWQMYVFGGPSTSRTWLALWDFSAPLTMTGLTTSGIAQFKIDHIETTSYWQWRPVGKAHNGTEGYKWNVTLPPNLGTSYQIYAFPDRVISGTGFAQFGTGQYNEQFTVWAVSTKEGERGRLLWNIAPKPPVANVTLQWSSASVEDGVLVLRAKETRQLIGFDINTGKQLWITDSQPAWMMYSSGSTIAYGKVYSAGYGGEIFAYDAKTGKLNWTAAVDNEGLESAYVRSPLSMQIVDGKVYIRSSEHSMTQPYYRTWRVYCFDAETGNRLWDLNGAWSSAGFADGYMVAMNYFDGQIYCIGKGPSATTVEAPMTAITAGDNVVIQGTVTDIAAGTKSPALTARFPNGVPAVSDASMDQWMEYVYMQKPRPQNATGVEVSLDAVDPNNNFIHIGTTTSDASGTFGYTWTTPDVPGTYQITATFEDSKSYYGSHAETYAVVSEAPPATAPPEYPQPIDYTLTIIGATVVLLIAIVLVGIWIRRK